MSASSRTKDGFFSVTGTILANEEAAFRHVPIDMDSAMAWGRENGVDLRRTKQPLDRINAQRAEFRLPPFKITKNEGKPRRAQPVVAQHSAALRPLVSSEDDLLDRITTDNSTLTGLVTPQIAEWMLKLNTSNRPIEQSAVERFCKILRDGAWLNTGEPVIVSHDGILNDGQHRLTAIYKSGTAAELDVRFGIAREAFHATGTGKRRTAGQVLSIDGYSNTSCQAAIARLLIHYDKGQMGHLAQVENGEILRVVNTDDYICEVAAKIQRSKFKPTRVGPFGFILVVAARTAPLERVFEFADLVSSGLAADEMEPARCLHVKLRDAAIKRDRISQIDIAIMTSKTWNAWVLGDVSPQLRILESERTNAGFPVVREWRRKERLAA
jgi:hypothetical protein